MMKYKIKIKNPIYGVPLTSIDKLNRRQFRILGNTHLDLLPEGWKEISEEFFAKYRALGKVIQCKKTDAYYYDKNEVPVLPYARILIRKIK